MMATDTYYSGDTRTLLNIICFFVDIINYTKGFLLGGYRGILFVMFRPLYCADPYELPKTLDSATSAQTNTIIIIIV